jgi:hypothetical protein
LPNARHRSFANSIGYFPELLLTRTTAPTIKQISDRPPDFPGSEHSGTADRVAGIQCKSIAYGATIRCMEWSASRLPVD